MSETTHTTYNNCLMASQAYLKSSDNNISTNPNDVVCPNGKVVSCCQRGTDTNFNACMVSTANDVQPCTMSGNNGKTGGTFLSAN